MTKPQISWQKRLFWSLSLNLWAWIEIRTTQNPVVTSHSGKDCDPVRKLCPESRQPGWSSAVQFGKNAFLVFPPNLRIKLFYASQILFVSSRSPPPPPPPRHATLAPRQAVTLINVACPLQEGKIIYLKTRALALKNTWKRHVDNCTQKLCFLIRVKVSIWPEQEKYCASYTAKNFVAHEEAASITLKNFRLFATYRAKKICFS